MAGQGQHQVELAERILRQVALRYSRVLWNLEFRQVNEGRILVIKHL